MTKTSASCRIFAVLVCLCIFAVSAAPVEAKNKSKHAPAHSQEALQHSLVAFGKTVVASYNRCIMPSKKKMHVVKNHDGSYTAEYMEADPNTVSGAVKPAVNPGPVKYIGYLRYTENKYVCKAKTKAAAMKGPFTPIPKTVTELIKYMNGKWTY